MTRATPAEPAMPSTSTMSQAMPHAHNYHAWVFESFRRHLRPGPTLEVGSGHAAYARRLSEQVPELIVSDIDPEAVERVRAALPGVRNVRYVVMDGVDRARLEQPLDNVVLLNLLEHVERDAALLAECHAALGAGGILVVFSPAFPMLYARMDAEAGHFRRYSRAGLSALMAGAGFELVEARLFNAVGFFGWLANKVLRSGIHSASTNAQITLYDRLIPVLRHADRALPFLGQSLLVVGRKQA